MEDLKFTDKLHELGISYNGNKENKEKIIKHSILGDESDFIKIKDFICQYINDSCFYREPALNAIIKMAINMDEWKHSMHLKIDYDNYDKFIRIIQGKILDRAKDIDFLLTTYFLLRKELSDREKDNLDK